MLDVILFTAFIVSVLYWIRITHQHEERMAEIEASKPPAPEAEPADNATSKTQKELKEMEKEYSDEWWEAYAASGTDEPIDKFVRFHVNRGRTARDTILAFTS